MTHRIIETVGPCPITGYPLIAVHGVNGSHAGLALASISEHLNNSMKNLPIRELASKEEVIRSWVELLIFAAVEHNATNPLLTLKENGDYEELLQKTHHYDTARITASIHVTITEHLNHAKLWEIPEFVLIPDVGIKNFKDAATETITTTDQTEPQTMLEKIRFCYYQQILKIES